MLFEAILKRRNRELIKHADATNIAERKRRRACDFAELKHSPKSFLGEVLGLLPGEVGILAAEVTVASRLRAKAARKASATEKMKDSETHLGVDGAQQLEVADDPARAEVEALLDESENLLVRLGASAVGVNEHRQRLGDTDRVRDLLVDR